jgi:AraC-like DNA-binding protein
MNIVKEKKTNNDIYPQFTLKDILSVYYKCPPKDRLIRLHSPCNQFTFGLGRRKTFQKAENSWTLSKNTGIFLKRTIFMEDLHMDHNDRECMAFYLKDDYLKAVYKELRPNLPLNNLPAPPSEMIITIIIDDRTRNCYTSLIPYINHAFPLPEKILELKFKELLYNILINPANVSILSHINSLMDEYLTPVWEIMEKYFMYDLKLPEYAKLANRSLASFKREFKDFYHVSPGKWLTRKRLQRAKRYLETSEKNISEVAFENGFTNLSHFSRIFKENYGKSPVDYRCLHKR